MRERVFVYILSCILVIIILANRVYAEENKTKETNGAVELTAKSAVLMEGSTGKVIYEKNKDEQLIPASITKIMTLLLIFESLEEGKITLTDMVPVSEHAASMGGSQVFLEPYETQTVDTMIKCISIASANDAAVSMAEFIAGSETAFVDKMNEKAKELGMENTHFLNCCGLDDDITEGHYSSAYDVALMSRELIMKYPQISNYSTIWMDTFTHVTKKGESDFGLTNTNKLVRTYNGITGLKTGSTSKAKYCLAATANRDNMNMIAVVMAAPDPKERFVEAARLLDYGFSSCKLFTDENRDLVIEPIPVKKGKEEQVEGYIKDSFSYICMGEEKEEDIQKEIVVQQEIIAPIEKDTEIGTVSYYLNGMEIGKIPILTKTAVEKATYQNYFEKVWRKWVLLKSST